MVKSVKFYIGLIFICCSTLVLAADEEKSAANPSAVKLLILCGTGGSAGGIPNPDDLTTQVNWINKLPVDGMVLSVSGKMGSLPDMIFIGTPRFEANVFDDDISKMKKLLPQMGTLQENFVRLDIGVINFGWYDDKSWSVLTENLKIFAQAARSSGAAGILLDTEQYGYSKVNGDAPFDYQRQKNTDKLSFRDYRKEVRKRGEEFSRAIAGKFPRVKFLITFSTSAAFNPNNPKAPLSASYNGLFPAFLDGMMDGAPESEFIDCYENSYYFKTRAEFAEARKIIMEKSAAFSADPVRYKKLIRVAFGLYLYGPANKADLSIDFDQNSLRPDQYEQVIRWAMELSDSYVWLYDFQWTTAPKDYVDAIKNVRKTTAK